MSDDPVGVLARSRPPGVVSLARRFAGTGRRPAQALADQAVSSLTNFATALVAARLTTPTRFGSIALALSLGYMSLIIGRALVGEPLLARVAQRGGAGQAIEASAMRMAALIGLAAALLVGAASLIPWSPLSACWLVAPWLPSLVVQDTARYAAFARRKPGIALASDMTWAIGQAVVIGVMVLLGSRDVLWAIGAWGVGATAGAVLGCWLLRLTMSGGARSWLRLTWRYSGWLAPQLIIGQLITLAVNLIVAALFGTTAVGALRAMVTLSMPIFVLLTAAQALVVPDLVATLEQAGITACVRRVRSWTLVLTTAGMVIALGCIVFSRPLTLALFGHRYVAYASFVVPFGIGAALHASALLPGSGLRAFRDPRSIFLVQLAVTPVLIGGVLLTSIFLTPYATAWAMTSQGLATSALSWLAFSRTVRRARAAPVAERTPDPSVPVAVARSRAY